VLSDGILLNWICYQLTILIMDSVIQK